MYGRIRRSPAQREGSLSSFDDYDHTGRSEHDLFNRSAREVSKMEARKWIGAHTLALCAGLGLAVFLVPVISASDCQQPPAPGEKCKNAYKSTPTNHMGKHECGGSYTEIAHDGTCESGEEEDCCDLGQGSIVVGQYLCNSGTCEHTLYDSQNASVCDC